MQLNSPQTFGGILYICGMKKMLFLVFALANTVVYAQSKKQGNGCLKCNEFEVGETFELDGVTYTVADRKMLDEALEKGEDLTKYCTSKVTDMIILFYEC